MTRKLQMEAMRDHHSLRLPFEMDSDMKDDLDDSAQTLGDTVERFKPIQAEFLQYVQHKQLEDDSLSQLSYCVNDSNVDKIFDDVYDKGKVLGEGGFAFVYQCRHVENRHMYAVKECIKNGSEHNQKEIKNEVAALRRIKESPLFVRLLDVFDQPDRTYLVMEEMKGGDLLDKLSEIEVYEEWEARRLMRTLVEAVAYCHKRKICHRDIKPENILLPRADDVTLIKLADFGCAKQWKKPSEMETLCGSPQYVAPEVVGERPGGLGYNCQCDLWSCGVVLYIVLGGYAPFESEDEHDLLDLICNGEYEFDEEYWGDVEDSPKELIAQLLQVNPRKRLSARQSLNSSWLRRRDKDWIEEMDDSQSSFGTWLEKRNSLHSSRASLNYSQASLSTGSSHNDNEASKHSVPRAESEESAALDSNNVNQESTNSLNQLWEDDATQEDVAPFAGSGPLSPGPGQDSSIATGFGDINLSAE